MMTARERAERIYRDGTGVLAIEREIQAAVDEALEEAAKVVATSSLPDVNSEPCLVAIASDIRAIKSKPAPHANAIQPAKDANAH